MGAGDVARHRQLERIATYIDGLDLSAKAIAELKRRFCRGAQEFGQAEDPELHAVELELKRLMDAAVQSKRHQREEWDAQALGLRRPLVKAPGREEPPAAAEKTGTA